MGLPCDSRSPAAAPLRQSAFRSRFHCGTAARYRPAYGTEGCSPRRAEKGSRSYGRPPGHQLMSFVGGS